MSNASTPVWTSQDSIAADAQGWGIFETSRCTATEAEIVDGKPYGHRPYELQRDDEKAIPPTDKAAHEFVAAAALKDDALALRALAYLEVVSPLEYAAIVGEVSDPIRVHHALSNTEYHFGKNVGSPYAVAYCYCEENHRLSELFAHLHDGKLPDMLAKLPMNYGKSSVGCGDWVAVMR